MVRKVVWTKTAQQNRKEIYTYWNNKNKSTNYSNLLNNAINRTLKLLTEYPRLGKSTKIKNVRVKILKDYLIIYEFNTKEIIVLSIWDTRQNPNKLNLK